MPPAAEHEPERPPAPGHALLQLIELRLDVTTGERYVSLDFSWAASHRHVSSIE